MIALQPSRLGGPATRAANKAARACPMPDPIGSPLLLCPAYGRVYQSAAAMLADWDAGNDFKMYGCGSYCSVRDMAALMQGTSSLALFQASPLLTVRIAGFV